MVVSRSNAKFFFSLHPDHGKLVLGKGDMSIPNDHLSSDRLIFRKETRHDPVPMLPL